MTPMGTSFASHVRQPPIRPGRCAGFACGGMRTEQVYGLPSK